MDSNDSTQVTISVGSGRALSFNSNLGVSLSGLTIGALDGTIAILGNQGFSDATATAFANPIAGGATVNVSNNTP